MGTRGTRLLGVASLVTALSSSAWSADAQVFDASLRVRSIEYGDWPHTVAALQADRQSEGRAVHIVVEDAWQTRSACDHYELTMDEHGARAFREVRCDPATGATELRLADRTALFELGSPVSIPRRIAIAAVERREGSAEGGAVQPVEADLRCQIAVRPMLIDMLTGARVPATPDRYTLRPIGDGVRAVVREDAWSLRSGALEVEYELIERSSGRVVSHDRVRMQCGNTVDSARLRRDTASVPRRDTFSEVIDLHPDRVFRGSTVTRGPDEHGSCGGHEGPEQWYLVTLTTPRHLGLRLVSEFDATVYIRQGSIDGPEIACRDDAARLETIEMSLAPGLYYVAVDGTGSHGRYRLVSFEGEPDASYFAPR